MGFNSWSWTKKWEGACVCSSPSALRVQEVNAGRLTAEPRCPACIHAAVGYGYHRGLCSGAAWQGNNSEMKKSSWQFPAHFGSSLPPSPTLEEGLVLPVSRKRGISKAEEGVAAAAISEMNTRAKSRRWTAARNRAG